MATVLPSLGRETEYYVDGTKLCGWETFDLTYGGTAVDITNNCSDGVRVLLDQAGLRTRDFSASGTIEDGFLRAWANDVGAILQRPNFQVVYPNGDTLDIPLINLTDFSESNPMNEKVTFSVTLQSSGSWTYTAA
jgi:predicted secreted protein